MQSLSSELIAVDDCCWVSKALRGVCLKYEKQPVIPCDHTNVEHLHLFAHTSNLSEECCNRVPKTIVLGWKLQAGSEGVKAYREKPQAVTAAIGHASDHVQQHCLRLIPVLGPDCRVRPLL